MRSVRILGAAILLVLPILAAFGKDTDYGPVAHVDFVVIKDYNNQPVRNAAVILHQVSDKGQQGRGGIELKTDPDGKANYDGIPYGKIRVQVLMHGFQTFGQDYDINQAKLAITIRLKRPVGQYSTYEEHPSQNAPDTKKDGDPKP